MNRPEGLFTQAACAPTLLVHHISQAGVSVFMKLQEIADILIILLDRIGRSVSRPGSRRSNHSDLCAVLESLESRELLAADFGDAPDKGRATGVNDYQTLSTNNGPRHVIDDTVDKLFMGRSVDGETGIFQSVDGGLDDRSGKTANINAGIDDEDGIANARELEATVGSQPVVNVRVTNLTNSDATLYGWLDANRNGVFDTPTERVSVPVPSGTNGTQVALTFPQLQLNAVGTTYLRLRLSSDDAAANPTGSAIGGEIEDHRFYVRAQLRNTIRGLRTTAISHRYGGGPNLVVGDFFGWGVAPVGDVNLDGINDLAVSAPLDGGAKVAKGAVYILFMNSNGLAKYSVKIGNKINGGPELKNEDYFGAGIAPLGDLDGDGITELAITAADDDTGGKDRGAIYIVWLNKSGGAKKFVKLAPGLSGMPQGSDGEAVETVSSVGDLDGDGIVELAVGSPTAKRDGKEVGKLQILFLNANGTVKRSTEFLNPIAASDTLSFGTEIVWLGDLNRDGATEIAVTSGPNQFASPYAATMDVISLKRDGTVQSAKRSMDHRQTYGDLWPRGFSSIGDINGDGVPDIAFTQDRQLKIATLNTDGSIQGTLERDSDPKELLDASYELRLFGGSTANLGDINGDGSDEFAIGTPLTRADNSPPANGGIIIMSLKGVVQNKIKPPAPEQPVFQVSDDLTESMAWPIIDEARSYELYLENLTTKRVLYTALDSAGARFIPPADWPIGKYSIKVRSKNEFGVSAWSKTQTFLYRPRPVIVSAPSDMIGRRPVIAWQPVNGAARYVVSYYRSFSQYSTVTIDAKFTQFMPPVDLEPGTYTMNVFAVGVDGVQGNVSYIKAFTVAAAPEITAKLQVLTPRPEISWSAISDANAYAIEIWKDDVAFRSFTTQTLRFQPDIDLPSGMYRFVVRGVASNGQTGEPASKSFEIIKPPAVKCEDIFPLFQWPQVPFAAKYEAQFEYPGRTPGTTVKEIKSVLPPDPWHDVRLFIPMEWLGTVRISVRAISSDGVAGNWSPVLERPFPYLYHYSEYDRAVKFPSPDTPLFTWMPVPGAEKYRLEIQQRTDAGVTDFETTYLTDSQYQPVKVLTKGEYRVRVLAIGYDGTEDLWQESVWFRSRVAPKPKDLPGPSSGTRILEWAPIPGIVAYNVIVRRGQYSGTQFVNLKSITKTSITTPKLPAGSFYYYWVQGITADGRVTEWSLDQYGSDAYFWV